MHIELHCQQLASAGNPCDAKTANPSNFREEIEMSQEELQIGRYLIQRLDDGSYLFRQEGGEAATFKKEMVEKMIADFYLENF